MAMMKFSAGYQLRASNDYLEALLGCREQLADVYFAWYGMPSGRSVSAETCGLSSLDALQKQKDDLTRLSEAGIPLVLLLNANCYGGASLSRSFFSSVGEIIDSLSSFLNIEGITTTSPVIARFIRKNYPAMDVRASVNMEIGTVESMDYLGDIFTGFYMKREYNRDIGRIKQLSAWCGVHGKTLHILANGGCLAHCPVRQFHDNLVAHEAEIANMDNAMNFSGLCREYFSREGTEISYIKDINFIRPEDVKFYTPFFDTMKLATRVSKYPSMILNAFVRGSFNGNLLELLEPDYSAGLFPYIINNRCFPENFGKYILLCNKKCQDCGYCESVLENVLCNLKEDAICAVDKPND
jgi:ferredoxin